MLMDEPEKIKHIKTKENFLAFVHELSKSYYDDPESWENNNLGTFLDALASWVEDMEGFYINHGLPIPENLDWKFMANMLGAAKIYE